MVTFSPDVKYSYAQIRSPESDFTWALYEYNGDKIIANAQGDGFPDLSSMFKDDQVQYAYLQVSDKYVLVRWVGSNVSHYKKAQEPADVAELKKIIIEFQAEVLTSTKDDLSKEKITGRLP